jgi:archaellum biogenesis ATPase FlaH
MIKTGIVLATYLDTGALVAGESIAIVGDAGSGRSTLALELVATLIDSVNENHVLVITDEYTKETVIKKVSENLFRLRVAPETLDDSLSDVFYPEGITPNGKLTVGTSELLADFESLEDFVAKQEIDAIIIDGVFPPNSNNKSTEILNHLTKFQVMAATHAVFTAYTIQSDGNRHIRNGENKLTFEAVSDNTSHVFLTEMSNGKVVVFESIA